MRTKSRARVAADRANSRWPKPKNPYGTVIMGRSQFIKPGHYVVEPLFADLCKTPVFAPVRTGAKALRGDNTPVDAVRRQVWRRRADRDRALSQCTTEGQVQAVMAAYGEIG